MSLEFTPTQPCVLPAKQQNRRAFIARLNSALGESIVVSSSTRAHSVSFVDGNGARLCFDGPTPTLTEPAMTVHEMREMCSRFLALTAENLQH